MYKREGSRAVGEQEDMVFQADLSNLTMSLVGLNCFERECIQHQVGRQTVKVVKTNMDDMNLCFFDSCWSVEGSKHNNGKALLFLPYHPPNEKGGQESACLVSRERCCCLRCLYVPD